MLQSFGRCFYSPQIDVRVCCCFTVFGQRPKTIVVFGLGDAERMHLLLRLMGLKVPSPMLLTAAVFNSDRSDALSISPFSNQARRVEADSCCFSCIWRGG